MDMCSQTNWPIGNRQVVSVMWFGLRPISHLLPTPPTSPSPFPPRSSFSSFSSSSLCAQVEDVGPRQRSKVAHKAVECVAGATLGVNRVRCSRSLPRTVVDWDHRKGAIEVCTHRKGLVGLSQLRWPTTHCCPHWMVWAHPISFSEVGVFGSN